MPLLRLRLRSVVRWSPRTDRTKPKAPAAGLVHQLRSHNSALRRAGSSPPGLPSASESGPKAICQCGGPRGVWGGSPGEWGAAHAVDAGGKSFPPPPHLQPFPMCLRRLKPQCPCSESTNQAPLPPPNPTMLQDWSRRAIIQRKATRDNGSERWRSGWDCQAK